MRGWWWLWIGQWLQRLTLRSLDLERDRVALFPQVAQLAPPVFLHDATPPKSAFGVQ